MSGTGTSEPDLLEGGGSERARRGLQRPGRPSFVPPRLASFVDRHRRATGWVAAGLALALLAGVQWYQGRPPPTPRVVVTADRSADSLPLWSAGNDGRPSSPVTLSVPTTLAAPDLRPGDPQVTAVGLSGPGLSGPGVFPHRPLGHQAADFDLTGRVDCEQVPLPLPKGSYQVLLQVRDGRRTSAATVALPDAQDALDARVVYGCSTWLAARDLTVTSLSSTVDPVLSHLDLRMVVTNTGARDGLVWLDSLDGTGVRASAVQETIPAHRATKLDMTVDLDRCPTWSQLSAPVTTTDTPIPIQAAVGIPKPVPADSVPLAQGANGLVLTPPVAEQLQDAFVRACGGVASPVMLTRPGGTHYDARTRILSTSVLVDLPPGVVRSVRFLSTKDDGSGIVQLDPQVSGWIAPDHSGQAGWTVRFSVPRDVACLGGGPWVTMDVLLQVDQPDGRLVRFTLSAETLLPQDQLDAACARG